MKKKTGAKVRKSTTKRAPRKQTPPLALKVACPSCGAPMSDPCILLTAPSLSKRAVKQAFANNAGSLLALAPSVHGGRLAAYEKAYPKPVRAKCTPH